MLIFDVVERSKDTPMQYEASREGSDWKVHIEVREDAGRHVLTRAIRVSRKLGEETRVTVETHRLQTFDRRALEAMLAAGRCRWRAVRPLSRCRFYCSPFDYQVSPPIT